VHLRKLFDATQELAAVDGKADVQEFLRRSGYDEVFNDVREILRENHSFETDAIERGVEICVWNGVIRTRRSMIPDMDRKWTAYTLRSVVM
jgi:hypothetical protein